MLGCSIGETGVLSAGVLSTCLSLQPDILQDMTHRHDDDEDDGGEFRTPDDGTCARVT